MISKKLILRSLVVVSAGAMLFSASCKKDRVPQDDYQSTDEFYDDNADDEDTTTIDSTGGPCDIVLPKGTHVCIGAAQLEFPGGGAVTYPFQIVTAECYSIKDMILKRVPSTSGGNVLETAMEFRLRAFKNGTEVFLKTGAAYSMTTAPIGTASANMDVYYGVDNSGSNNWVNSLSPAIDAVTTITPGTNTYSLNVGQTGWVSPAMLFANAAGNTSLTLTVPGTGTGNIQTYLSFTGFKGVMKIENLASSTVPLGQPVNMVAFGKKVDNNFYMDYHSFTTTANAVMPLNMVQTTEAGVLGVLGGL